MANIYEHLSYRKWVSEEASHWKKARPGHTFSRLAQQTGVQAPYLTNVLKERAHLNTDQFYALSQAFSLKTDEINYGLLLLEWERSSHQDRKQILKSKIDEIRKEKLKTEAHIKATTVQSSTEDITRFYLNPELQLIHSFLGIEKYAKNLDLIAQSLHLSPERVEGLVKELNDLGYIQMTGKGITKTNKSIHLPKSSPLCRPQQLLMHHRALQHLQALAEKDRYNFTVTFTADEPTREKIHREFLRFLSTIEPLVKEAPGESVYQIHFDLFPWSS
jgi:uncharacterized protein (TIGR02147 family)